MQSDPRLPSPPLHDRLIDWLTPAVASGSAEDVHRNNLLVVFGLVTLPFALLYAAVSYLIEFRVGVGLMAACFVIMVSILLFFRHSGRFRWCANLYLACCFFVAVLGCSFFSGGIRSMVLPWFALVPITAVLLFGSMRETAIWTLLTCLVIAVYGILGMRGFRFPLDYQPAYTEFFNTMCIVGLALILLLIAGVFARIRGSAMAATQAALSQATQARDEAEAATRAKSRFLAAASHDLRQPIQAMHLFQDALGRTPLKEDQRRLHGLLNQATGNLAEILNALLDVSKLDSGMVVPHPGPLPASELFHDVETEFAALASARGLRFKLHFPAREMTLLTDGKLLHNLLRNLIDNAIKYTPAGGILVGIRRRGGEALLQVWDTGIGIPREQHEAIFDEYVQLANPERDRGKGLGLGLSIARRLVHLLGGRISCRSRPGAGSVFEVRLPLSLLSPAAAADAAATVAAAMPVPTGLRVTVVEDDPMVARALDEVLRSAGFAVATYASAEDALAAPDIAEADFYISDFRLPGMNGSDLLDAIQERVGHPIEARLLTGELCGSRGRSLSASRWKVLFKPIDGEDLLREIRIDGQD